MLCIQEINLAVIDEGFCSSIWGSSSFDYSYWPLVGVSSGLLTVWNFSEVEVWSTCSFEHVMLIHGRFLTNNDEFYLLNVYAPCEYVAKQLLWETLFVRLRACEGISIRRGV